MTTVDNIRDYVGVVNNETHTNYITKSYKTGYFDWITISKEDGKPFTFLDLAQLLIYIPGIDNFKVSLQYGDDGGYYNGRAYMDEMYYENGKLIFNGDTNKPNEDTFTVNSIKAHFMLDKYKDHTIYIQNMDDGGDYSGSRPMEYLEIYISKTEEVDNTLLRNVDTVNRINLA